MSQDTSIQELADHLFRREAGKMVAMLTAAFGARRLQLAEDVVQDTLMQACATWTQGIPTNPVAGLYRVSRNKAIDALRRSSYAQQYDFAAEASAHLLNGSYLMHEGSDDALVSDDLLRIMYACSHPANAVEGATALILKTLCGFSIAEIAHAFLTTEANISKRLYRATPFSGSRNCGCPFHRSQPCKAPVLSGALLNLVHPTSLIFFFFC